MSVVVINCAIDWCEVQRNHCGDKQHTGCNPNVVPFGNCKNLRLVPFTNEMKQAAIDAHNEFRNKLAKGGLFKYPSASSMIEMTWDDDLAETAGFLALRCRMQHDKCRGTPKYPKAGQNLAVDGSTRKSTFDNEFFNDRIRTMVNRWNDEIKDVPPILPYKLTSDLFNKGGHFTVIARENNHKVGCAFSTYEMTDKPPHVWYWNYLVCNYSDNNFMGSVVYKTGRPCSQCAQRGCSKRYSNLCAA